MSGMLGRRRSRGQAMVEFALVAPLFFLLVFAIIDFGRYVYTTNGLEQAAREAARIGSVGMRDGCASTSTRDACIQQVARGRVPGLGGALSFPAAATGEAVSGPLTGPYAGTGRYGCFRVPGGGGTATAVALTSCRTGDLLRVRIETEFTLVTPLVAQYFHDLTISGEALVTVNQ